MLIRAEDTMESKMTPVKDQDASMDMTVNEVHDRQEARKQYMLDIIAEIVYEQIIHPSN